MTSVTVNHIYVMVSLGANCRFVHLLLRRKRPPGPLALDLHYLELLCFVCVVIKNAVWVCYCPQNGSLLLGFVPVCSCACVRLHAYSAREGTNIARTIRFCARLDNKIDRF